MLNKIYLGLLAIATIAMCFFTFYAHSWFGSIGSPQSALEGYYYFAGLGSIILAVSSVILLVTANVILWSTRRAWAIWTTFVYFAIFVLLRTFWLEKARYNFENSDSLFFTPMIGAILVIVAGTVVFINQFLNLRLSEKMYPALSKADETPEWAEEKPEN